jgi:hypothetical protein
MLKQIKANAVPNKIYCLQASLASPLLLPIPGKSWAVKPGKGDRQLKEIRLRKGYY